VPLPKACPVRCDDCTPVTQERSASTDLPQAADLPGELVSVLYLRDPFVDEQGAEGAVRQQKRVVVERVLVRSCRGSDDLRPRVHCFWAEPLVEDAHVVGSCGSRQSVCV